MSWSTSWHIILAFWLVYFSCRTFYLDLHRTYMNETQYLQKYHKKSNWDGYLIFYPFDLLLETETIDLIHCIKSICYPDLPKFAGQDEVQTWCMISFSTYSMTKLYSTQASTSAMKLTVPLLAMLIFWPDSFAVFFFHSNKKYSSTHLNKTNKREGSIVPILWRFATYILPTTAASAAWVDLCSGCRSINAGV